MRIRSGADVGCVVLCIAVWWVCVSGCVFDTDGLPWSGVCGDGVAEGTEECDLPDLRLATCQSLGFASGTLGCTEACVLDTSACIPGSVVCGDGVREGGEQCDGADLGGQSCGSLGLGSGALACTHECSFNTQGCAVQPVCGNGQIEGGEECDDGNTVDCDGCSAGCLSESCGNGRVECDEECDDGNQDNTDACLNDCTAASCGDGYIRAGVELCDTTSVPSSCVALGYAGGILRCAPGCLAYDTSQCTRYDGEPCTADSQCLGGTCYDEVATGWPSGFCTRTCGGFGQDCLADFACIDLSSGGTAVSRCYKRCTTSAQCRPGHVCRRDPFQGSELVCRPACETNAHCPDTGICDPWIGWCGTPANPANLDNGAACTGGFPYCKGGLCYTNPPGGYCLSQCNLATGVCPGDGVCLDIANQPNGDLGYCADGCTGNGDCRPEYSCATFAAGTVCWPTAWL